MTMRWSCVLRVILFATLLRSGLLFAQSTKLTDRSINGPAALSLYNDADLFVVEFNDYAERVLKIDLNKSEVTPIAGNGKDCCYEEGALATEVNFDWINSIAVDGKGNLYISDGNYVRKVDAQTGRTFTVAGNGEGLRTSEGRVASTTTFGDIVGLAADAAGNLFVCDGAKIFEIGSTTGILSHVAGNGTVGFSGDGELAVKASFRDVRSIAVDQSDNVIVADTENCRVRRIDHATGIIFTIARTGGIEQNCPPQPGVIPWQLSPDNPAVDAKGNVYFNEPSVGRVAEAGPSPDAPIIVAGTGEQGFSTDGILAISAQLHNPSGLAVDSAGNIFIADFVNNRIFRVDAKTKIITTVAGNGLPHRLDPEL
jgi:trimeric autotransporter adhesin